MKFHQFLDCQNFELCFHFAFVFVQHYILCFCCMKDEMSVCCYERFSFQCCILFYFLNICSESLFWYFSGAESFFSRAESFFSRAESFFSRAESFFSRAESFFSRAESFFSRAESFFSRAESFFSRAESFSHNKTKLKETQISSNDKKEKRKKCNFYCIWCCMKKNIYFCFDTEISDHLLTICPKRNKTKETRQKKQDTRQKTQDKIKHTQPNLKKKKQKISKNKNKKRTAPALPAWSLTAVLCWPYLI